MSIQQAASFSPDAIINGLSILTIGYFIYLYDKKTITIPKYTGVMKFQYAQSK